MEGLEFRGTKPNKPSDCGIVSSAPRGREVLVLFRSDRREVNTRLGSAASLLIQRREGSRSRVRRTRGAMGIESILVPSPFPGGNFGQNPAIDTHR